MSSDARAPAPVVFGCAGARLTTEEAAFFRACDPFGLILFRRNCHSPDQVRALIADFHAALGRDDAPVLIDQEGGRVQRLAPPHWRDAPPPARFGRLARDRDLATARRAAALNARLIAAELADLGVMVNCVPCLDLPAPGSHGVIGDRAFCADPEIAAALAQAVIAALLAAGVLPVIKHLPGHGRAGGDSHEEMPVVSATAEELRGHDLRPFIACREAPLAMTAHLLYQALDPERPATQSALVIGQVIRGEIGFEGLLFSDDLRMSALSGGPGERAARALDAGCDVVLYCAGAVAEMESLIEAVGPLSEAARGRWRGAQDRLTGSGIDHDPKDLERELASLLA